MGKSNTCYFSHDANALTDIKISAMRSEYGLEGYGLYWAIIEKLRNEDTYKLPLEKNTYRAIKIETGTTIDVEKFIKDCIEEFKEIDNGNGLFNTDEKFFWSESLLKRMTKMEEVSLKRKKAGQRGAEVKWENKQQEVKKTKKRKIKNIITKNSKNIANAIKYYGKCYKNYSKSIAKNGKIKSKSKSKIKIKIKDIKSIYLSHQEKEKKEKKENLIDEIDKIDTTEFEKIICNLDLNLLDSNLANEIKEIIKELYVNSETKEKIKRINSKNLFYALKNFTVANTKTKIQKPKEYFKKCLLSALEQTELNTQYDTDTIYDSVFEIGSG